MDLALTPTKEEVPAQLAALAALAAELVLALEVELLVEVCQAETQ